MLSQVMDNIPDTAPTVKITQLKKQVFELEMDLKKAKSEVCAKELQCAEMCSKLKDITDSQQRKTKKACNHEIEELKKNLSKAEKPVKIYEKSGLFPGQVVLFRSKYSVLSPFAPTPINTERRTYPDAETLYQCKKAEFLGRDKIAERIRNTRNPGEAKMMARQRLKRFETQEWHEVKREVILNIQLLKAEQCQELKEELLRTGNKHYSTTWSQMESGA